MRHEQFDAHVTSLVRALRGGAVDFMLLEDDDMSSVTVVAGPSQRNLERLVRALKRAKAEGRVPGERQTFPLDFKDLLAGGSHRWLVRIDGADAEILLVGVEDGAYGRFYDAAIRRELAPGLSVDVVADAPTISVRRVDAVTAMGSLRSGHRDRERRREIESRAQRRRAAARR